MKIYGKIIRDKEEWETYHGTTFIPGCDYYAFGTKIDEDRICRDSSDGCICGCSGKANQLLGKSYSYPPDTMSWGYHGNGSDLTAAWLITQSLWFEAGYGLMGESINHYSYMRTRYDPIMSVMLRHYKQFSEEVISNLSDEWEMDTNWIKQWVMEKEAVPV